MFEAIAIVDNNLERRNSLYQVLSELNYQVTTMPSTIELIDFLNQERPPCVIVACDQSGDSTATTVTLHNLRELDKSLKIVALLPPNQIERLGPAMAADPRLTVLNAELDQMALIRSILSILKEREVERVDGQVGLQGNVLVIEDEPRIAQLFSEYLKRRGYKVSAVKNGEEALLQMQLQHPKIVILDILLPGMDGLLTLQRLKAMDPSVAVIVASGFEDMGLINQAAALGAVAYLIKPFNLAKLEAAILTSTLHQTQQ